MHNTACLLAGLLTLAVTQSAPAAKKLGPPIDELLSAPQLTRIALAVALESDDPDRAKFRVTKEISGDSPGELLLRADEGTLSGVVPGENYIVAWTDQRKVRLLREGYELDPDGPSIVTVSGLMSQGLFRDSSELRYLFTALKDPETVDRNKEIDALLAQVRKEDPASRDLAVGQLMLDAELGEQMSASQASTLREVLASDQLLVQHRDYLLQVAQRIQGDQTREWLAEEFRKSIIWHGTQYDLSSFVPALMVTSARGLQEYGEKADVALLGPLLYSNNPGVAKAALGAMDQLDAEQASVRVNKALERGWLSDTSRRALQRYLKDHAR